MTIQDLIAGKASVNDLLGEASQAIAPVSDFSRGVLNSMALGIPEYVLKKTGVGKDIENATGVNVGIDSNAAKLGDIAGAFVPTGLAAKGLTLGGKAISKGAKALLGLREVMPETAKVGKGLLQTLAKNPEKMWGLGEKAVEAIRKGSKAEGFGGALAKTFLKPAERMLPGALAGALPSMAEQGVRSFTSEQSLPDALKSVLTAGGIGALSGGVLGALSKNAGARLGDLEKESTRAVVGQNPAAKGRILKSALPYYGGGKQAGGFGKMKATDELINDVADITKKLDLDVPGKLDEVVAEHAPVWQAMSKAADDALPKKDAVSLLEKFAPKELQDSDEIYKVLDNIPKDAQGIEQLRTALYDAKAMTYNEMLYPNPAKARAMQEFVNETTENINKHVIKSAEEAKLALPKNFSSWDEFRKSYKVLEPLARGDALSTINPAKFNLGSPTAEKLLAEAAATGEEAPKGLVGKMLIGIPGGKAIQGALSKTMGNAVGAARPLIQTANKANVGGKIEKLAPEVAAFGGNIAGKIGNAKSGLLTDQPKEETLGEALKNSAAPEVAAAEGKTQGMAYQDRIDAALKKRYETYIKPQRPDIPYEMFYNYVKAKTYNFNPELSGGILSLDPEYKKSYSKTISMAKKIEGSLEQASKYSKGLVPQLDAGGQSAEAAYAMLEGSLIGYLKDQGISDKEAKALVKKAASSGSMEKRRSNIYKLLIQTGANPDALADMGVV